MVREFNELWKLLQMINVRKATWHDRDNLYKLATTDDVREASFNHKQIDYQEHLKWLKKVLHSSNEYLYILEIDGNFSGQVRFSYNKNKDNYKVGISIVRNARGKNIAVKFFKKSLFLLRMEVSPFNIVKAYIRDNNIRSQKFFEKAGFKYSHSTLVNDENAQKWILKMNSIFVIAELSANHNHNIDLALETISAIKKSGADAVKIQTYTADTITVNCDNEYFQIHNGTLWDGRTLYDLYQEAYTPWEWHDRLRDHAESLGLMFFSTPFDKTAVDFLETKNVPIYKIASFEITDIPLIEYTASKGKPMIISTGIAERQEIQEAVESCRRVGNYDITLLKCTSSYPAPIEEANLKTMVNMIETFGVKVGLSDHTLGSDVAVAAAALGAEVIEKHFILDRSIGGPDAAFSMEPNEFNAMVDSIRNVEKALGTVTYKLSDKQKSSRKFARSLFVVEDIKAGEVFNENNVRSIRPGDGLSPKYINDILGRKAQREIHKGSPVSWDMIKDN